MKRALSTFMFVLLLVSTLTFAFNTQNVKASGTIYIRADGSIDPPTAPISTSDNVTYTLTGNITSDADGIVVERDNIVVDGAGFTVQGTGGEWLRGMDLNGRTNVTIKNMEIKAFHSGVFLLGWSSSNNNISGNNITNNLIGIDLGESSSNSISGNNITDNAYGVVLDFTSNNSVSGNNITDNDGYGVWLDESSFDNSITENNITNNNLCGWAGIQISRASDNNISGNIITNNGDGIWLYLSSNNSIAGNNITDNDAYYDGYGVYLDSSSNNVVSGNNITNNQLGIYLDSSSNNSVSGNNITNNGYGIELYSSSNYNSISGNNITANNGDGIELSYSSNYNSISGNNITANNGYGIELYSSSNYNSVSGNNITNNECGINLGSSSNYNSVSGNNITNNGDGIALGSSSNNSVSGNNITNNDGGIWLYSSSNNSISGNNITNNEYGLMLLSSSNNSVSGNNITANNWDGIYVDSSSSNRFYHNNIINNTQQVESTDSVNVWDDGYPSGGNYWSDYTGIDQKSGSYQNETGSDGIGDSPYVIDSNNQDTYPLVNPWRLDFTAPTNHPIVDFAVYNGSLYAAADNKLYVKEGSVWSVIDASTFVTSLEPYGGKLVVGGQGGLYCYDGTSFTLVFSVPTYIKVLGVYSNTLYAGTMLGNPPRLYYCNGSADNPSNWYIDTSFSSILNFSGPFGSIDSFAVYNNAMHVGSGGALCSFNGTEWNVATSFDDVYAFLDMQVYNGKLYLATRDQGLRKPYYQGGTGFSGRVIEFDGENCTAVFDHDYWIFSLEIYNDNLYAGTANRIFTYNGTDWEVSFNTTEGAYYAISMITYDGKIYAGMGNGYIFVDPAPPKPNPETTTVPEFSPASVLTVFMALTILATALIRKKRTKRLD